MLHTSWLIASIAAGAAVVLWILSYFIGWRVVTGGDGKAYDGAAMLELSTIARTERAVMDLIRRHPKTAVPVLTWTELAIDAKHWPEAVRRAEEARKMFPRNPDVYAAHAKALARGGRLAESDDVLRSAMKRFPSSALLALMYAENARSAGNTEETLNRCEMLRKRHPTVARGYSFTAGILLSQGRDLEAEEILQRGRVAVGAPLGPDAVVMGGTIVEKRGDWAKAAAWWAQAAKEAPTYSEPYLRGSAAYLKVGNRDAAVALLEAGAVAARDHKEIFAEFTRLAGIAKDDAAPTEEGLQAGAEAPAATVRDPGTPDPAASSSTAAREATADRAWDEAKPVGPPLEIMMHIAFRGDVRFPSGAWAGGEGPDQRIEGFAVTPAEGLDPSEIEYRSVGADGALSPPVAGGTYCGSRGKGAPLHGVAIRTTGAAARTWQCEYAGRFGDGTEAGPVRQGEACRSASGAPLLALRLRLAAAAPPREAPAPTADRMAATPSG